MVWCGALGLFGALCVRVWFVSVRDQGSKLN